MYFRTGYRPTRNRGSGSGIGVADAASIGGVVGAETSEAGAVSAVGVIGPRTSGIDVVSTVGVSGVETSGVGVVSTVDVAGAETSGAGVVSAVDAAGAETSGGEIDFLGSFTWGNWTFLTWADNELKEPVNVCDTKLHGTTKMRSAINPHPNIVPIIRGTGFVDWDCGKGCVCIGNGGKGTTPTSFRLWLFTLSFFTGTPLQVQGQSVVLVRL